MTSKFTIVGQSDNPDDAKLGDGDGADLDAFEEAIEGVGSSVVALMEQFGKGANASAIVDIDGVNYEVYISISEIE